MHSQCELSSWGLAVSSNDDFAVRPFDEHPFDGGLPFADGDGEFVAAEPIGQSINVASQLEPRELDHPCGMGHRHTTRKRRLLRPLNEERQQWLPSRLLETGGAPTQHSAVRADSRSALNGLAEPLGDLVEIIRTYSPAARPATCGKVDRGDPTSEVAPSRLILVDYRDKFEITPAKRHDPVCSPPACMAAALERRKPMLHLELMGGCSKIGNSDQDVVDLQATIIRRTKSSAFVARPGTGYGCPRWCPRGAITAIRPTSGKRRAA